ncbi:MAG: TonB-dependent receptor [Burkholderiales bacterium]|nr:TonB-dependent receptor [Burkholderiales bacterium]
MNCKQTPIASAVAVAMLMVAYPAYAADSADTQTKDATTTADQTITVTGIRASKQASLAAKKNAVSVVEVITAEDVGKMPDKNVADSLQRVAGVNTITAGGTEGGFGENDRISLRGTPAALALTTLNGHTVSSGDWYSLNIQGGGRSVSYSLLPSELVGRITVHKSSQADFVEGGASGSVDIETRKPLELKDPLTIMGSAEAVHSTLADKTDGQYNGLISWKNPENTVGLLVQGFSEDRHLRRDGQEFLWWDTTDDLWGGNSAVLAAHPDLKGKYITGLTGSSLFLQERKRKGGLIDAEFKPAGNFTIDLSGFYSKLDATNYNANFMLDTFNPITAGGISPSSYTISGNTVTSLQFPTTCPATSLSPNCSSVSSSVEDIAVRPGASSSSQFINADLKYKVNDQLSFSGKLGTTKGVGTTKDIGFEVWMPYVGGGYQTHGLSSPTSITLPGANTPSIGGNSNTVGGWASDVTATDKETYFQIDGKYLLDFGSIDSVQFGIRSADHKRSLEDVPGTVGAGGSNFGAIPSGTFTNYPGNFGSGLGGGVLANGWTLPESYINNWANQNITFAGHIYQSEFNVDEPVQAAYAMANLNAGNLTGNIGVRVVGTEEKVTSNQLMAANGGQGTYQPVTTKSDYTDVLPSANFRLELDKNLIGRFAVNRSMARPELGQLAGLTLFDIQQTGSGGNPKLKPIRSNNFDLGLEWYFGQNSRLSAELFYMDLETYVTFGSYTATFYNQSQKQFTQYRMSGPVNTTGEVKGLELSYQQPIWGGFGVEANYTMTHGKETQAAPNSACATTGDCDLIGTSKNAYNLGVYYENQRFNARVTYNYRSAFLNGLDRSSAIYQDAVGTVGASLDYSVTNQLTITAEGKDLNNPVLKSYASTPDQPRAFYTNGRQYYVGLRYKY